MTGPFEQSEAGGLRATRYVVPKDPTGNRATWRIEVPREDTYYLWLRHLLRGKGGRGGGVRQHVRVLANGKAVATLGGGHTDLNIPDSLLGKDGPQAPQLWTWAWPGKANLDRIRLPAGQVELTLEDLAPAVRYDVLFITDEPSFVPRDGRLRQR